MHTACRPPLLQLLEEAGPWGSAGTVSPDQKLGNGGDADVEQQMQAAGSHSSHSLQEEGSIMGSIHAFQGKGGKKRRQQAYFVGSS